MRSFGIALIVTALVGGAGFAFSRGQMAASESAGSAPHETERETRATLRDPFTVTILVTVPLVALLLFGLTLSTEVKHLNLGLHDANGSAASRRLTAPSGCVAKVNRTR